MTTDPREQEILRLASKLREVTEERDRLLVTLGQLEDDTLGEIDARDYWESRATHLAEAVGEYLGVDVGEHSSANCPILNAFDALDEATALRDMGQV